MWGFSFNPLVNHDEFIPDIQPFFKEILKDRYCFMFIHNTSILNSLKEILPNAKILEISNVGKFYNIAAKLKDPTYVSGGTYVFPDKLGDFVFDIDNSIFEFDTFKQELTRCCQWLNVSPNFDDRLEEYYNAYMSIHQPTIS
jgi:hypothetical protein